jgi:hypothetical protein
MVADGASAAPFKSVITHREAPMNETLERKLLLRDQVATLLQIPDEDVQWLIDTRQLLELRIRGHIRFDSKDLHQLLDSYKITQGRHI